jgi:4-diphosphocytidyl-2-C-methyl-D-erythritol kinase
VAAGLAGGSADAAAALVALDRLWCLRTPEPELVRIGAMLGSDVPFALVGGTALGTGRGELVESVHDPGTWWWVLAPAATGLSTPEVYRRFDDLSGGDCSAPSQSSSAGEVLEALGSSDPRRLARALHNDLQDAAIDLRPELATLLARGESVGALRGVVSGSGPTCAFLCESGEAARWVCRALRGAGHAVALVVNGPVGGAASVSERVD